MDPALFAQSIADSRYALDKRVTVILVDFAPQSHDRCSHSFAGCFAVRVPDAAEQDVGAKCFAGVAHEKLEQSKLFWLERYFGSCIGNAKLGQI